MIELIIALLTIALMVPAAIWGGFVLMMLWGWFFVPLGLPSIGVVHAIGISLLISFVTMSLRPEKIEKPVQRFGVSLLASALALGFGYLAHLVMVQQ